MEIKDFIKNFKTYPILFIGTGISLRYLEESFSWEQLLQKICFLIYENDTEFYDLRSDFKIDARNYDYIKFATFLEKCTNDIIRKNKEKFCDINELFYEYSKNNKEVSRFRLLISKLLKSTSQKKENEGEILDFKNSLKNINSIITTNYDTFLDEISDFIPLVGNDILLSNPYGSLYKIHGSVTEPSSIIITSEDYEKFNDQYELIKSQLISFFICNPIIFLGYSINDPNIKNTLRTIFKYVPINSDLAKAIQSNFLLIEYTKGLDNLIVSDYDIDLDGNIVRINCLKTDNYSNIYKSISELHLPISAMDIRKVQHIIKEIKCGGDISVKIVDEVENLANSDLVLAIGKPENLLYTPLTVKELFNSYFNLSSISNLNKINELQSKQKTYFPIHKILYLCKDLTDIENIKNDQLLLLVNFYKSINSIKNNFHSVESACEEVDKSMKTYYTKCCNIIFHNLLVGNLNKKEVENYLKEIQEKITDQNDHTSFRRLLCLYDLIKYGNSDDIDHLYSELDLINPNHLKK